MLEITIPKTDLWNEETEEFVEIKETTIKLEHSLVSISKWESKWHVPFLGAEPKSNEMLLDYIKCMTITQNVDPNAYLALTEDNVKAVNSYIEDPMTATTIRSNGRRPSMEIITSEIIYYWMIQQNIPVEFQKWHINRLLMLIQVCNNKNSTKKKMSRNEILARNEALNEERRAMLNSKG